MQAAGKRMEFGGVLGERGSVQANAGDVDGSSSGGWICRSSASILPEGYVPHWGAQPRQ